jgi:hypothetical protein
MKVKRTEMISVHLLIHPHISLLRVCFFTFPFGANHSRKSPASVFHYQRGTQDFVLFTSGLHHGHRTQSHSLHLSDGAQFIQGISGSGASRSPTPLCCSLVASAQKRLSFTVAVSIWRSPICLRDDIRLTSSPSAH